MNKLFSFILVGTAALFSCSATCFAQDFIIDVRSPAEYESGHAENSINIVFSDIVKGVTENDIKKDDTIYVYCLSGKRAERAKNSLNNAGYQNVINLGGYEDAVVYFKEHPVK